MISDWEARMDSYGRVFYIDHKNHTTTWQKPTDSSSVTALENGSLPEGTTSILNTNETVRKIRHQQERQQLDKRYQCIRKSIARNASVFLQDVSLTTELAATPTLTAERQRELLVKVLKFNFNLVSSILRIQYNFF
jgi:hypothetical protein